MSYTFHIKELTRFVKTCKKIKITFKRFRKPESNYNIRNIIYENGQVHDAYYLGRLSTYLEYISRRTSFLNN